MLYKQMTALLVVPVLAFGLWGCDIEETEEGRMPEIGVEGDSGQLPEYEVEQTQEGELPSIDDVEGDSGEMPEYNVEGPDIQTDTREIEMTVPTVDVDAPEEGEAAEAEAEADVDFNP